MQKTDTLIKVISVIVFIAIVFYIGYYLYDSNSDPLVTAAAMEYTIRDSAVTEGYAVRTEEQLDGGTTRVSVTATEGEKLSAGSTYALKFDSREAMEAADRARELEARISWLEALALEGDDAADIMARESVQALAYAVDSDDLSQLHKLIDDVSVKVFQSSDYTEDNIQTELAAAEAELDSLKQDAEVERLKVEKAGVYSQYVDGFEGITPENVQGISPSELTQLFITPENRDSRVLGKLVTDISWYYAAVMEAEDAMKLEAGESYELEFSKTFNGSITMKVKSIGTSADGRCVVVFVSDRNLNDTIATRKLTAEVLFTETTGIRIPKEAVNIDEDGVQYVYVISGVQAQRVDITILTEYDEYYLVEADGNLRDGMEVIVEAKELYSGKVVR